MSAAGPACAALGRRASAATHGVLVYGTRRIVPGSASLFRSDFEAWAEAASSGDAAVAASDPLRAAFAFPDPADPELLHCVFWSARDLPQAGPLSSASFVSSAEDPDTLDVYGSGQVGSVGPGLRLNRNASLAGFMRVDHPGTPGPPMIGFFKRAIKPGHLQGLVSSFQVVCDMWHEAVPGMLAATVSRDPEDENTVHDIRVFADKASYAAHVDKSNAALTQAMEEWFDHYDTSVPHRGALFAEDTDDASLRTSSIKDKPVKVAFNQFHYGSWNGMVGEAPVLK